MSISTPPWSPEPQSEGEFLRALYRDMQEVKEQTKRTNGRVTRLEKFMWMVLGALVVVASLVVPIFLNLVQR
jgi:hypothetical protein